VRQAESFQVVKNVTKVNQRPTKRRGAIKFQRREGGTAQVSRGKGLPLKEKNNQSIKLGLAM